MQVHGAQGYCSHFRVQAVGKQAREMVGRTPSRIKVLKPLRDGVIADFKVTEYMLSYFIQSAHQRRTLVHPRIIVSVPSEITQVERRAVTDSAYRAKAAEVHLVEQATMAALGAGLPVNRLGGNLVVDIGGGTTDIALISMSGIVYSRSLPHCRQSHGRGHHELRETEIQLADR